ncbi:ribbon-helix-helix domain-containing protein [Sinosporangium siamense]|uniref:Ribbon-helix-helix protein CopG domain-containing protein n=1 Tax=Sinosporangium siamense TaxID=1367973 RepID=A0A919V640_9ACTN|nr:CopG family transcriptional regulator [Sinosporangium siamense]GII92103.1 hypothetical protein Ssi02_23340 [Sinosporangium siamense]
MSLKRTNVYADPEDLAIIKEAAIRRGVPEAEIIREAIHLAALASRVWDEPLDWPTFDGSEEPITGEAIADAVVSGSEKGLLEDRDR